MQQWVCDGAEREEGAQENARAAMVKQLKEFPRERDVPTIIKTLYESTLPKSNLSPEIFQRTIEAARLAVISLFDRTEAAGMAERLRHMKIVNSMAWLDSIFGNERNLPFTSALFSGTCGDAGMKNDAIYLPKENLLIPCPGMLAASGRKAGSVASLVRSLVPAIMENKSLVDSRKHLILCLVRRFPAPPLSKTLGDFYETVVADALATEFLSKLAADKEFLRLTGVPNVAELVKSGLGSTCNEPHASFRFRNVIGRNKELRRAMGCRWSMGACGFTGWEE